MLKSKSGIVGYVHSATSITLKFASGQTYRYDVSAVFSKDHLKQMVALAKKGSGLNAFLNKHPYIRKYGYLDETLGKMSFHPYG